MKNFKNKGFTLIELIVVIAIIAILTLLALPKLNNYQQEALKTKVKNNMKVLEDATEQYYLDYQQLPISDSENYYTKTQLEEFSTEFLSKKGDIVELDENDKYYLVDYSMIRNYAKFSENKSDYFVLNTKGEVIYLKDLTDKGKQELKNEDSSGQPATFKTWLNVLNDSGMNNIYNVIVDKNGNYVIAGTTNSTTSPLGGVSYGDYDAIVAKFSSTGTQSWLKRFGGNKNDRIADIVEMNDGSYLVVGHSLSTTEGFTADSYQSAFISKFDSNGNQKFLNILNGNKKDVFNSAVMLDSDNYIVVGSTDSNNVGIGTPKGEDGLIVSYKSDGTQNWIKSLSGTATDTLSKVKKTNDGGFVVVGATWSGDLIPYSEGDMEALIAKFDKNGNQLWSSGYSSYYDEDFKDVLVVDDGYIAIGSIYDNGLIVKFGLDGVEQWNVEWDGNQTDIFDSIHATTNENFVVTGYSSSTNKFTNNGGTDFIQIEFDKNGNQKKIQSFGTASNDYSSESIKVRDNGYVIIGSTQASNFYGIDKQGSSMGVIIVVDNNWSFEVD